MEFVKVRKGTLETNINVKQLKHYQDNGWEEVEAKPVETPKTYDKYTKKQLVDICRNRDILVENNDNKSDIIKKLVLQDNQKSMINNRPSNKGFTDNLIIE